MALKVEGVKKKKKVYLTNKNYKHKHIKKNLATLRASLLLNIKYYKIDGTGKVVRWRKEILTCGKDVFMAKHMDRH